ncbi:CocE/NonD family hydrolase [Fimbriiglobus ruber]|nr:CocE/NonD family hydrolase [Fimbriiglobus ruber]
MRYAVLWVMLAAAPVMAQAPDEAKINKEYLLANYTKFEYRVPMRDGIKLFTAVYTPKDTSKLYPMLLLRTPYGVGPYGPDSWPARLLPSPLFWKAGYIFVHQDVRGRMKSEGTFLHSRPHNPAKKQPTDVDESSDTYDTIDWLVKNITGHNGKVGQSGISYPGFYTACGMIDAHPALKAVSPQAPLVDFFDGDDCRHNGAFLLAHNFRFFGMFPKLNPKMYGLKDSRDPDYGTPDGYQFFLDLGPLKNIGKFLNNTEPFWADQMAHPDYDEFCRARNLRPHIKGIKPAVLTVGGWYDAEDLAGTFYCHNRVAETSPDCPQNVIVMGPWVHGGWARGDGESLGPVKFNAKTSAYYREHVELPFFEQHLKGNSPKEPLPKTALMFETGTNRWRRFDTWPPAKGKKVTYSFAADQKLTAGEPPIGEGYDEYVSDPRKPVPYVEKMSPRMENDYMTADQRFAGRRTDVLVYQTPVLTEDTCVAGPVEVELHVSTTGTDSDFVVKLIDVYPSDYPDPDPNPTEVRMGGYQQLVRGEPFRGKYRTSLSKPEPFEPGKPTVIKFAMPDVCHAFRSGHRIMVQVQSSWFPFIDRNPQTFCDIATAKEEDFKKATQRVYRSEAKSSGVTLRIIRP